MSNLRDCALCTKRIHKIMGMKIAIIRHRGRHLTRREALGFAKFIKNSKNWEAIK